MEIKENGFVLYQWHTFCDLGQITFNGINFLWGQLPRCCAYTLNHVALSVIDERTQAFSEDKDSFHFKESIQSRNKSLSRHTCLLAWLS